MWSRQELKYRAQAIMAPHYWTAFLVSALAALLTGLVAKPGVHVSGNGVRFQFGLTGNRLHFGTFRFGKGPFWPGLDNWLLNLVAQSWFWAFTLLLAAFSLLFLLFVANPIRVGEAGYYIRARNGQSDFSNLLSPFSPKKYQNIVGTMFQKDLRIFLWSLLLVIPGIYKYYSYYLVPYILAENPNIAPGRAMEISEQAMDGERMNTFILELSFLGWYIVGSLLLGVGTLFVLPYVQTTYTEFYGVMRYKILSRGICSPQELTEY